MLRTSKSKHIPILDDIYIHIYIFIREREVDDIHVIYGDICDIYTYILYYIYILYIYTYYIIYIYMEDICIN